MEDWLSQVFERGWSSLSSRARKTLEGSSLPKLMKRVVARVESGDRMALVDALQGCLVWAIEEIPLSELIDAIPIQSQAPLSARALSQLVGEGSSSMARVQCLLQMPIVSVYSTGKIELSSGMNRVAVIVNLLRKGGGGEELYPQVFVRCLVCEANPESIARSMQDMGVRVSEADVSEIGDNLMFNLWASANQTRRMNVREVKIGESLRDSGEEEESIQRFMEGKAMGARTFAALSPYYAARSRGLSRVLVDGQYVHYPVVGETGSPTHIRLDTWDRMMRYLWTNLYPSVGIIEDRESQLVLIKEVLTALFENSEHGNSLFQTSMSATQEMLLRTKYGRAFAGNYPRSFQDYALGMVAVLRAAGYGVEGSPHSRPPIQEGDEC